MKYPLKQGLRWCMLSMAVSASAQVSTPVASTQLPTGGKVMSGTTSIQSVGNVLTINQSSQRSAINWNTFNVGSGAKVNFIQPSSSSVTLNRVLDTNGSQILGSISANGQVFISNPNGVLFGPNSQVNVGGLIATTQNISVDDFMAGKSTFEGTGAAGAVVNQGTLEAALGGYIALLASSVRNEGVVLAREGTVAFAAGDRTVVQFNGPQLVTVMVDRPVLDALVENKQMVRADGGLVIFSARSANAVLSSVIRNTGTIQANTIVNKQGRILLEGGSQGVVEVGGTLQTSGVDAGTQGGTISATGDKVSVVSGALLDATGQAGGGNVLVGGGWQGSDSTIPSANAVNIASGAVLNASAIQNGKGGTVVAWSDTQNTAGVTKVQGTLLARGGIEGGDGGRIETSGRWLSTNGASGDASASKGTSGQWLFDPYDVEVVASSVTNPSNPIGTWTASSSNSQIQNTDITNLLNAGTSVTISTGAAALPTEGNITINAPILRAPSNNPVSLTLSANQDITINQPITLTGSGSKVQLNAGHNSGSSAVLFANNVSTDILSMDVIGASSISQTIASSIQTNNLRINAPNSDVTLSNVPNNFGALATQTNSLNLTSSQGIDRGSLYGKGVYINSIGGVDGINATGDINISVLNGNIFVERSIATQGNLTLNAGTSIPITPPYIPTNTNNPYGPNIILSPSQNISVGATYTGKLYTGGFGNSGASLATYLGALGGNNSRYNSDEITSNFTTPIGNGLTAIYRQKPILTVTAPDVTTVYGTTPTLATNMISGLVNGDTQAHSVSSVGASAYTPSLSTAGKQNAGTYSIAPDVSTASSGLGYGFTPVNGVLTVTQKALNLTGGITASSKTYDGTTATSLSAISPVFSNLEASDIVNISATGAFVDKNAGLNKPVNISSVVLSGTDSANYNLVNAQTTALADIAAKPFAVSAIVNSANKVYDSTRNATVNLTSNDLITGDSLSINYLASFDNKNTGNGKLVTVGNIGISGADASNYLLQNTFTTTLSNISPKSISLSGVIAQNKVYDATTSVTLTGNATVTPLSGDNLTLSGTGANAFSDPNVGVNKSVLVNGYSLTGADAGNYSLTPNLMANITAKVLTVSGTTVANKVYDTTTTANLSNGSLVGVIATDATNVTLNQTGTFSDKNVGTSKTVTSNDTLSGIAASNYSLTQPTGLSANITARSLTFNGISVLNKTYDGTSTATLLGTAAVTPLSGDTVSVSGTGLGLFADKNTGINKSVTVSGFTLTGTDAGNYLLMQPSGMAANISKANAVVTGISNSINFDGTSKTINGFTVTGLATGESSGDIARSVSNPTGVAASASGKFPGTYLNVPSGSASNYNLSFVNGQLVITGCPGGPPCTAIGSQTTASNTTPIVVPISSTPSLSTAAISNVLPTSNTAPVITFPSTVESGSIVFENNSLKSTTVSSAPIQSSATQSVQSSAIGNSSSSNSVNTQPVTASLLNRNLNSSIANTTTQPNVITAQRLADILNKKDPIEIATAIPPTQIAQLSPEQVAPLVNSLNLRQLMSLTNEQITKFDPARQTELLNIIKVIKDNPEKATEKAFTSADKTFTQLAANGLLKEQIDTLSTRVTQISQNRTTVNIDTPQKLAELLTKKDPVEIASALPSNQVVQLTSEQVAPLINSLSVRQLLALTNEQISKFDPARQTELLNIINVIKNNPERAADKTYNAIDKTTAEYIANGLMKEQIDALASRVTQISQNKTTINLDSPQRLVEILNKNTTVEIAAVLPSKLVPQLTSDQVAPLINSMSVKQLLSLTNEQISRLDPARLAELLNILKGLKDNPEKATDKTYTPEDTAVAKYAATGLLKDSIERLSLRANYIADNKFKDPLGKELADLTNPPVPTNFPTARNTFNQANRPLNAAQIATQNTNRETPNLTPTQIAALDPKDLGPLLSQLNANQLMAITNAQMAGLEATYLNQLTVLLNFVQDRASNPVANLGLAAPGNRVNNTNIYINQPVAKLASAALLADQPNPAPTTTPSPSAAPVLAGVALTPKQVSELDPAQLTPLINQLNANQLMAITNAQMARLDGRALNQLTILMNFVQQRAANTTANANGNNPANGGTNTNINVFVNQPVSRLASNALLNEQPKPDTPAGSQPFAQTNISVNLTPKQVSELNPAQLAPLISQLNATQLMAITNSQMARLDTQAINQLNILMNFVQQRALNSNTVTTAYNNQPVSRIAAAMLMNDQPLPTQTAGVALAPVATVPLSPQQIANLSPNQIAPLLNRMNSRQLLAVTDTQMASLDSNNLNQLITLLNFIQNSATISPVVANNIATRPVAGFLPPELNTSQTVTQP